MTQEGRSALKLLGKELSTRFVARMRDFVAERSRAADIERRLSSCQRLRMVARSRGAGS